MILGNVCTRRCEFCHIETGKGEPLDSSEPLRVAQAAEKMRLRYVVVTSVTRDDLMDEGARHFADTIKAIRDQIQDVKIEVLVPDFHAREELIDIVLEAHPDVFNHNVETVRRLQKEIRPQASYECSLSVLEKVKKRLPAILTKSGLMLGLGEKEPEIYKTASDLRDVGCDILTIGQYLQPGPDQVEVVQYVEPEKFDHWAQTIKPLGFRYVFSGPYVRSSYHADEAFLNSLK